MWHMSRLGAWPNQGMIVFNSSKCSRKCSRSCQVFA